MRGTPLILIVDDTQDFREIFSKKFTGAGFECAVAKNGLEGMKKAEELMPDLIFMDISMPPGPSGIETALAIKENPKTKDINIVFLTSMENPWPGMTGDKQMISKELGMQGYFDKAQDLDVLSDNVKKAFQNVQASQG